MIRDFDSIIFHAPCSDGVSSLWSALYYKDIPEKISCKAGVNPINSFTNKNIIFVDICPTMEFLIKTSTTASYILILDHHKSAYDNYMQNIKLFKDINNIEFIFDMDRSGCQMTWDYFFVDKDNNPISRPWFIDYIADRDLWTWKLEFSKEINASLNENNLIDQYDLSKLTNLLIDPEDKKDILINQGKFITRLHKKELDSASNKAVEASITISGINYRVWLGGNISNSLRSELGNLLTYKKFTDNSLPDFTVIWLYEPKMNEWWISLRGSKTSPDLSIISKNFGGGGHSKASGFIIKNGKTLKDYFVIK